MLKIVNQYWQFDSEEGLNNFLDNCMNDNNNEFNIERYGQAKSGKWYAYGVVIPLQHFNVQTNAATKAQKVAEELNLG